MADTLNTDLYVAGWLGCQAFDPPDQCIGNPALKTDANDPVAWSKLQVAFPANSRQADGSDVASVTEQLHIARKAGTVVAVEVQCIDAPSGGDKQFTVDIRKYDDGAPTPATILYEAITIDSTISDGEVVAGTITDTTYSDGDGFVVVVTASGSTGTQGQGLSVVVWFAEQPL